MVSVDPRDKSFLTGPKPRELAGVKFRPMTAGSLILCRLHGLTLQDSLQSLAALTEDEAQEQVFTFLFIHGYRRGEECYSPNWTQEQRDAADFEAAAAALDEARPEFLRHFLIPFAHPIPVPAIMPFLVEWLAEENRATYESLFSLAKKLTPPAAPKEPDLPNASTPAGSRP